MSHMFSDLMADQARSASSPLEASELSREEWKQCVERGDDLDLLGPSLVQAGLAIIFAGALQDGLRDAKRRCLQRNVAAPEREGHIQAAQRFALSVSSLKRVIRGEKWLKLNEVQHIFVDRQCGPRLLRKLVNLQQHSSGFVHPMRLATLPATVGHMSGQRAFRSSDLSQQKERLGVLLHTVRGELFEAALLHAEIMGRKKADSYDFERVVDAVRQARLDYVPDPPAPAYGSWSHARLRHLGVDNLRQTIREKFDATDKKIENYRLLADLKREVSDGLEAHHIANAMRYLRTTGYVVQISRGVHRRQKEN